jgi:RNA polymerase sigma-70 factor (ECF subfamily)
MDRSGRAHQFHLLKDFLGGTATSSHAEIAPSLGLSESAARMAASRMRGRYRGLLEEEIAHTVETKEDIDSEIKFLFATFSG